MNTAPIRIAALGDIMLDRDVGEHFFNCPEDFKFDEIGNILGKYDLVLANLENPVGLKGSPHPKQDPHVAFRCHPDTLKVLKNLNVDVVTLANNHLLDYGEETLKDTLIHLDDANILHLGAGKDYEEANRPVLKEINGHKIAILSSVMIYSASTAKATKNRSGVADYNPRPLLSNISILKQRGYSVIVTIHWGIEYCFYPIPYQRHQAQKMIDAGASLIIGHGPHFPQGIEKYKHGEIVHSLGNFIFDEPYNYSAKSFIYGSTILENGIVSEHDVIPVILKNHIPTVDKEGINGRTGTIVSHFGTIYNRKNKAFWKRINNRWFSDIIWRITSMKSLKFALLPPFSFYFSLGFGNILKKFSFNNFKWAANMAVQKLLKKT